MVIFKSYLLKHRMPSGGDCEYRYIDPLLFAVLVQATICSCVHPHPPDLVAAMDAIRTRHRVSSAGSKYYIEDPLCSASDGFQVRCLNVAVVVYCTVAQGSSRHMISICIFLIFFTVDVDVDFTITFTPDQLYLLSPHNGVEYCQRGYFVPPWGPGLERSIAVGSCHSRTCATPRQVTYRRESRDRIVGRMGRSGASDSKIRAMVRCPHNLMKFV